MDINSLFQSSAQLFKDKLDTNRDGKVETSEIVSALMTLFSNKQGQLNMASIISSMQNSGSQELMQLAASWLGKGQNAPVSGNQLELIFGHDKIASFANQLGISESSALNGLQEAVPNVIDKASPNGTLTDLGKQLLNSVGGVSGAIDAFGKMFGRKT